MSFLVKNKMLFFRFCLTKAEALGLRWDDVDFENRIIHITHAAKYRPGTDDKAQWMITEPKTKAGIRDIPMIDQVYDALKAEYKAQQERGLPTPTNKRHDRIYICE